MAALGARLARIVLVNVHEVKVFGHAPHEGDAAGAGPAPVNGQDSLGTVHGAPQQTVRQTARQHRHVPVALDEAV